MPGNNRFLRAQCQYESEQIKGNDSANLARSHNKPPGISGGLRHCSRFSVKIGNRFCAFACGTYLDWLPSKTLWTSHIANEGSKKRFPI
jgi:hypothetical protein